MYKNTLGLDPGYIGEQIRHLKQQNRQLYPYVRGDLFPGTCLSKPTKNVRFFLQLYMYLGK